MGLSMAGHRGQIRIHIEMENLKRNKMIMARLGSRLQNLGTGFLLLYCRLLELILMERVSWKDSQECKLQIDSICSIRIRSRNGDIFKKPSRQKSRSSVSDDGEYTCRVKVHRSPLTFDKRFNVTVHVPPQTNPPQANVLVDSGTYNRCSGVISLFSFSLRALSFHSF